MSFARTIPIMLLSFLLSAFIFNPTSASKNFNPTSASKNIQVTDEALRAICMKTIDYYFCRTTFRMWDGIEHANIYELANVAILAAKIQARLNKHLVRVFADFGLYPEVKKELEQCYGDYTVTLGKLESAYTYADHNECEKAKDMVKDAMKMSVKCDATFRRLDDDIANPIDMYSFDLDTRVHIALIVIGEFC